MQCIESTKTYTRNAMIALIPSETGAITSSMMSNSRSSESVEIIDGNTECVWRRGELTAIEFVVYAFVVPSLAFFGLCANFINAIVFMRPKMTPSAFSYLAALSCLDCVSCLLITLTAFSRSFLYTSAFWMAYDFQWQTPLFGITTGAANLVLACVSLDRFIYLRWGIPNGTPKFCKPKVARRMVGGVIFIAAILNLPYFFVFVVNKDGTFETTEFYFSTYYMIHNWLTFIVLTVLPAVFLMIGNAAILIAFFKWTRQGKKCQKQCANSTSNKQTQNRYKQQMKLTITILTVITLYMVGELPAHLTSRKSAVNLLYGGDVTKVNFETMQRLEIICITLNAIQLSMNIIVYAIINPCFMPEFFAVLRTGSDLCFKYLGCIAIGSCCSKMWSSGNNTCDEKSKNSNGGNEMDKYECKRKNQKSCSEIKWKIPEKRPTTANANDVCLAKPIYIISSETLS